MSRPTASGRCRFDEGRQAFREEFGEWVGDGVKAVFREDFEGEELGAAMEEAAVKTAKI